MILDVTAAVVFTLAMLLVLAMATSQLATTIRDGQARRQLRALAEEELIRIRAGMVALPPPGETRLRHIDDCTLEMFVQRGSGQWNGFALVRIVGHRQSYQHSIHVTIAGYVPETEAAP